MTTSPCAAVRVWLRDQGHDPPPVALATHVAGCAVCRGALAALFAALVGPAPVDAAACAPALDDLAAFLDVERADGGAAARRAYPQVWWHLWLCRDCAETYRLLHALLDAEQAGQLALPALPPVPRRTVALPPLHLRRAFLAGAFAPHRALGVAWGDGDDERVLAERTMAAHTLTLAVRQTDAHCVVLITVAPPVAGAAVLRFGDAVFRAPLAPDGTARFPPLPVQLFTDPDGPDLVVTVEDA